MQSIITTTLYLLSILIPLTFTTINSELFEFPKFIILLSGTIIITIAWAYHASKTRDFSFSTSSSKLISYSLLFFLASQIIATNFSIHPYTSFWGYYSRFHGGLLTTICYTIIYFSAVKWLDKKSTLKLIKVLVGTSFLISLYAIAERFGIDKNFWIQDVQNRPFSTLGQPNWLSAYLIPHLFLVIYLNHTNRIKSKSLFYLIFSSIFIAFLYTKSRSGFIGFTLSYFTYIFLLIRNYSFTSIKPMVIKLSLLLIFISLVVGTPYSKKISELLTPKNVVVSSPIPSGTQLDNGGTESGDIRKIVWTGALAIFQKHPIVGAGPETFAYTYYGDRPTAHNLTSEWDFLYNKAHNEYLNTASTTGLIGLLAYLSFHFAILKTSFLTIKKTKKVDHSEDDNLRSFYPILGASLIGFTITNFFGFSVIPVFLTMVILASFASTLTKDHEELPLPTVSHLFLIPVLLIYPLTIFIADYKYAKGKAYLDAVRPSEALPYLLSASRARPGLDLYHSTLGETYALLGNKEKALSELKLNKDLNDRHLNFYKSRAKIYLTLATSDASFNQPAAIELEEARALSPTDPKLAYNLGLVYTRIGDSAKAEDNFRDAITLKPNYQEPYYALTLLLEQSKQLDKIHPVLSQAKANLATYSAQLKEKIEKYR